MCYEEVKSAIKVGLARQLQETSGISEKTTEFQVLLLTKEVVKGEQLKKELSNYFDARVRSKSWPLILKPKSKPNESSLIDAIQDKTQESTSDSSIHNTESNGPKEIVEALCHSEAVKTIAANNFKIFAKKLLASVNVRLSN